jgi:GTPase SAR1 family protein
MVDNREFFTPYSVGINESWQRDIHFASFVEENEVTLLIFLTGEASARYQDGRRSNRAEIKVFANSKQYTPKPVGAFSPAMLPAQFLHSSNKTEDVKLTVSWPFTGEDMAYTIIYSGCRLHGTVMKDSKPLKEEQEMSKEIFVKVALKSLFSGEKSESAKRKSKISKSPIKRLSFFDDAKARLKDSIDSLRPVALLGTSQAGKTSILRSFVPFCDEDRNEYVQIIHSNILQSIRALLTTNLSLRDDKVFRLSADAERIAEDLESYFSNAKDPKLSIRVAEQIEELWRDPGFRITFEKNPPQYLSADIAAKFFDDVKKLAKEDYLPTFEEMYCAYKRTTEIQRMESKLIPGVQFVDVGGRRNDRFTKWPKILQNCSALIYVVSIGDYDKNFEEDTRTKALRGSLTVFSEIFEAFDELKKIPLVLIFNKKDQFRKQFGKIPLSSCFEDWKEDSIQEAENFIIKKFLAVLPGKTDVYIFFTEATRPESFTMKKLLRELPNILNKAITSPAVGNVSNSGEAMPPTSPIISKDTSGFSSSSHHGEYKSF